jgi:hypothetical protein
MSELVMMEAALFQLRAAIADDPGAMAISIAANVLENAIAAAKLEGVNAARVNDIEFAMNDLVAAVDDEGNAPDGVFSAIAMLQNDVARLRTATAIPRELVTAIRDLQTRLRARAKAMERAQYRPEGTDAEPFPHPAEELRALAVPLARQLLSLGFSTPSLDELVAGREELRYHTLNEVVDELDAIATG